MSISQNFPEEGPSLNLNFASSKTLDPRITFTRTSSATYTDDNGLIRVAPINSPRFDHNPTTGESLGLLVEEQRTNLLLQSEDFTTTWFNFNSSETANQAIAPNGTLTADKFIPNAGVSNGLVRQDIALAAGSNVSVSVYAKAGEFNLVTLSYFNSDATFHGAGGFDLTTGSFISGPFNCQREAVALPNGWYRIQITGVSSGSSGTAGNVRIGSSNVGDGTSGIYIWGAQLEQGGFPTSYIPTAATTATRTADNASITGTNFNDFYNQSEGTTIIQIQNYNISNTSTSLLSYSGTTVPNNSMNYFRQLDAQPVGQIIFNGTLSMNIGLGPVWTDSSLQKHAFFYQKDNSGIANRSLVSLDTSVDIPVVERMIIGSTTQGNNKFTLSQLTYYPKRLTNSQLQNLTR